MIGIPVPSVPNSYSSYGFTSNTGYDFILNNGLYMGDNRWDSSYPVHQVRVLGFDNVSDVYAYVVRHNTLHLFAISLTPFGANVMVNNLRGNSKEVITCPYTPFDRIIDGNTYTIYGAGSYASGILDSTVPTGITIVNSDEEAIRDLLQSIKYPITYHYANSTVSGPAEAAVDDTVTVSAVPDVDYGITDPTTQIAVTNNDAPVSFTWDAATNTITFTMPDPT